MASKKKKAQQQIAQMTQDIQTRLEGTPTYEVPEETQQLLELYKSAGETMTGYGEQALSAAEAMTGVSEAPGTAIAKEQARVAAAGSRQAILEAGGGGASALGAIASVGQNELNALRDIAVQNQQYKSQAEQQYLNQLGAQAGIVGQAAQLEGAGLSAMAAEKANVYESELAKYQTQTQFDITQLGNVYAEEQARKARNAQLWSAGIQGVSGIAGAFLGGK